MTDRGLVMLPHLKEYVSVIEKNPKTYAVPTSKTFATVKTACSDAFMPAWLVFFESVTVSLSCSSCATSLTSHSGHSWMPTSACFFWDAVVTS